MNISSENELRLSKEDDNNLNNSSNISSTSNSTNTSTKSKSRTADCERDPIKVFKNLQAKH